MLPSDKTQNKHAGPNNGNVVWCLQNWKREANQVCNLKFISTVIKSATVSYVIIWYDWFRHFKRAFYMSISNGPDKVFTLGDSILIND